jgi:alkanesulfonate monooxygenase SsuD/methylene tetrahydromethanopterin reductase-like flavin-dependent oxidoreductase (luciferase family)
MVGTPDVVREQLLALAEQTGADEIMVTTVMHSHAARVRSYELLAEAFELQPRATVARNA